MSTSELFALRNKLLKNGFEEFRRIVLEEKIKLDINDISNLFLAVYQHDHLRKIMLQYITFFAKYAQTYAVMINPFLILKLPTVGDFLKISPTTPNFKILDNSSIFLSL